MGSRFYRRRWDESRGDEFAGWGHSVWYFEVDDGGWPVRQVEVYDTGPVLRMLGGYAIAGSGPRWVRGLCALVALSAIPIWSLTATDVGGSSMSLGDPHGAWAAVLYWGLLATFALAAAIPLRRPVPPLRRESRAPTSSSWSARART